MKLKFVIKWLSDARISKMLISNLAVMSTTSIILLGNLDSITYNTANDSSVIANNEIPKAAISESMFTSGYVTMLETYTTGYISPSGTEDDNITSDSIEEQVNNEIDIEQENVIMYVDTGDCSNLNVRELPSTNSEVIGTLEPGSEVEILEDSIIDESSFVKIEFDEDIGYIYSEFISETEPELVAYLSKSSDSIQSEGSTNFSTENTTIEYSEDDDSPILNKQLGTVEGPSGKETYYNLNMSKVIEILHDMGIEGEYHVREDGVKMIGDYIIVAANLDVHPRGTLVETSLGTGVVGDTGDFADDNPTQLDVAVAW